MHYDIKMEKKIIPENKILEKVLTRISLAHWHMGDGGLNGKRCSVKWDLNLIRVPKTIKFQGHLKASLPNDNRKILCGWTNYSTMVISQEIQETRIGYNGSKLVTLLANNVAVKEQRVDGSWQGFNSRPCLRCTLMGFDRNYQIRIQDGLALPWLQPPRRGRILSNQTINKLRFYSSKAAVQLSEKQNIILNSWWVTGFVYGGGCFLISITEDQKSKTGWKVRLFFEIHLLPLRYKKMKRF